MRHPPLSNRSGNIANTEFHPRVATGAALPATPPVLRKLLVQFPPVAALAVCTWSFITPPTAHRLSRLLFRKSVIAPICVSQRPRQ
jgi:hypothetical protein